MNTEVIRALQFPLPIDRHKWRVGSSWEQDGQLRGRALVYIDARDVMDRLDAVVGPDGWKTHFIETPRGRVICELSLYVADDGMTGDWITKSDGAGDTSYEGEKGAISDALKRAAVQWGIGRYLYSVPSPVVALEKRGKSAIIPDHELKRLNEGLKAYVRKHFTAVVPEVFQETRRSILDLLSSVDTADALQALWHQASHELQGLKEYRPDLYVEVVEAFAMKKTEVK